MKPTNTSRLRAAAPWLMAALLCGILAGNLAGCGQRGPLYLPDEPAPAAGEQNDDDSQNDDDGSDEKTP